jgi:predicted secreted protein
MNIVTGFVVFSITWFVVLFTVLPWGVRTQDEEGEVIPGTAESAPINPAIWKKFLATTIITSIFFGIFWATLEYDLVDYRALISDK